MPPPEPSHPKLSANGQRTAPLALLTVSALILAATASCAHRHDHTSIPNAQPNWARVSASHREHHDDTLQIIVHIELLDASTPSGFLDGLATNIAREPGVLTLESGEPLNLPASEGFQAFELLPDGTLVTRQGHDPALHRLSNQRWQIVVPIDDPELQQRLRTGTGIMINPDASARSSGAFQGVSFVWPT